MMSQPDANGSGCGRGGYQPGKTRSLPGARSDKTIAGGAGMAEKNRLPASLISNIARLSISTAEGNIGPVTDALMVALDTIYRDFSRAAG